MKIVFKFTKMVNTVFKIDLKDNIKKMDEEKMDELVDSILIYLPLFYKKITSLNNSNLEDSCYKKKATDHYQILGLLEHHNNLPISEIGKRLLISRPNMTSHINKLVSEGMVTRLPNKEDRRVIKISITHEGSNYIKESRKWVNNNIKNNLSPLNQEELQQMYKCIDNIKNKVLMIEDDHHGNKNTQKNTN